MMDLFIENLKTLKNFTGLRLIFALSAAVYIYLFIKEKNKTLRVIFIFMPLLIGIIFICPLTLKIYMAAGLDKATYYRMLWLIPTGIITIYGLIKLMGKYRILGVILSAALIALTGKYIYTSPIFYPSENIYGLPQITVDIVDYLRSIDDHERITVLPSSNIITTIRQYDANILMPYGRDLFNAQYNYSHPVYDEFEKPAVVNMERLIEAGREFDVQYYVIYAAKQTDKDPGEAGLKYLTTIKDHRIYEDTVIAEKIKEIDKYYGNTE